MAAERIKQKTSNLNTNCPVTFHTNTVMGLSTIAPHYHPSVPLQMEIREQGAKRANLCKCPHFIEIRILKARSQVMALKCVCK